MFTRNTARSPSTAHRLRATAGSRRHIARDHDSGAGAAAGFSFDLARVADAVLVVALSCGSSRRWKSGQLMRVGRRPGDLGERGDARERHVGRRALPCASFPSRGCACRPRMCLRCSFGDRRRHRLEAVDHLERQRVAAARRQIARALPVIQVQIRRGDSTVSWPALAAAIAPSMPRHDITVALGASPPSRISSQPIRRRPLLVEEFPHALDEVALQRMRVLDAELLHARLHRAAISPTAGLTASSPPTWMYSLGKTAMTSA